MPAKTAALPTCEVEREAKPSRATQVGGRATEAGLAIGGRKVHWLDSTSPARLKSAHEKLPAPKTPHPTPPTSIVALAGRGGKGEGGKTGAGAEEVARAERFSKVAGCIAV